MKRIRPAPTSAMPLGTTRVLRFARNWDRKVYADKANSYRYESARPGHGYVGLCVVDAVLEVFKHCPQEKTLLNWAKDYQDWTNTSSAFDHTKVDQMRQASYLPQVHAGALGLTLKVPGSVLLRPLVGLLSRSYVECPPANPGRLRYARRRNR